MSTPAEQLFIGGGGDTTVYDQLPYHEPPVLPDIPGTVITPEALTGVQPPSGTSLPVPSFPPSSAPDVLAGAVGPLPVSYPGPLIEPSPPFVTTQPPATTGIPAPILTPTGPVETDTDTEGPLLPPIVEPTDTAEQRPGIFEETDPGIFVVPPSATTDRPAIDEPPIYPGGPRGGLPPLLPDEFPGAEIQFPRQRAPFPPSNRDIEQAFCELFPIFCIPMPAEPAPAPAPPRPRGRRGRGGRAPAPPVAPPAPQPPTGARVPRPGDIPLPRLDAPVGPPLPFPPDFPFPPTFPVGPPIPTAPNAPGGAIEVGPLPRIPPISAPAPTPPTSPVPRVAPPVSIPAPPPLPSVVTPTLGAAARVGIGILAGVIGDFLLRRLTRPGQRELVRPITTPGAGELPGELPGVVTPVVPAPAPLTMFNTAAVPFAAPQAQTRQCRCPKCDQKRKRSKRRKCLARAPVRWAGGPRKGQSAGSKCIRFQSPEALAKRAGRKIGGKVVSIVKRKVRK